MSNETIGKTLKVAVSLCIVCALIVSGAAVMLKPRQDSNKSLDVKRNILAAAGMLEEGVSIEQQFEKIKTRVVDMRTGKFAPEDAVPAGYDQFKAAKDPKMSDRLTADQDIAKIFRKEHYSVVYMVEKNGELDKIVLPIRGYGLWGTLYGFVALENDMNTVAGLGFYDHKETPGLGGEVDNPRWKGIWPGKKIYGSSGEPKLAVLKGAVQPGSKNVDYEIDGLSGATLTSRGITNLVQFWMGDLGYKDFLSNLRSGRA